MAKKLTVEIEAQAGKAKKAAQDIGAAAAEGMERAAASSERIAANLEKAGDGLKLSAKQMASVAASMGGMLVGTAMKAVALKQGEDSPAAKALGYGGSALQGAGMGAAMGSVFGPLGTAIGALAGAAQGLLSKWLDDEAAEKAKRDALNKTNAANRELLATMLDAERRTKDFKDMIDSLGEREKSLAERQAIVAEEIAKREKMEERLKAAMQHNAQDGAGEGNQKAFSKQMRDYAANHSELERLRTLQKSFDKDGDLRHRTSIAGADSLARIGGDSFGNNSEWSAIARNTKEQIDILKSIDAKTGRKGDATWQ